MDPIESDPRFKKLGTDKKFRNVSKKHRKVKIDKRFESLFTKEKFVNKCPVDKRGRPRHLTAKENYEKFYQLDSEESSEDEDEVGDEDGSEKDDGSDKEDVRDKEDVSDDENDEEQSSDNLEDSAEIEENIKSKLHDTGVDYARGEGTLYSDSSSEEEDSSDDGDSDVSEVDEEELKEEEFNKWGEMDHEAERTEEITKRLAVCNMDWDRVGAEDIFLALSSFCPSSGSVTEVHIYLSEFGKERLEEEQTLGPLELRGKDQVEKEDEEEVIVDPKKAKEKMKAEMARVRQYQINRLKYYYAVVSFDNADTANRVYTECDSMEYELSATRFDLRFIPDDMKFEESPKDSCLVRPDQDKYRAKNFETSALQQQKVELTWDETDPDREKAMKKAYEAMDDEDGNFGDVRGLIASASEDDSDEEATNGGGDADGVNDKDMINKYRALLADVQSKEDEEETEKGNMEVKWDDPEPEEESKEEELGPWEKYLEKKKNKKKKKSKAALTEDSDEDIPDGVDMDDPFFAEELNNGPNPKSEKKKKKKKSKAKLDTENEEDDEGLDLMVMDSDDEKDHFNFKDIVESETKTGKSKKKWKKKKKDLEIPVDDNFSLDVGDNRFSALYSRPEYNIDPTDSNFKKTKNMEKIIGEKLSRLKDDDGSKSIAPPAIKKQKLDPEISSTLKSVKNKWKKNAKKNKTL